MIVQMPCRAAFDIPYVEKFSGPKLPTERYYSDVPAVV
jgi:hypothetical protein